ncbi:glycosyltransferase family 2 protein [Aestuariibaculum lutulentum]|uniref:Glycosyltransferase family 2 protein n=1 Tax=Aestuariibaculum lutulentum TaxID=2920935 RepID=A0ABS9RE66_9FLAO|nr:glycosyltransferase family A protein [Aestuariibaculum lutulentum]MCH4551235.1 glycosyltransferase family 2 protein [Aestuariibaculum lutulentum]
MRKLAVLLPTYNAAPFLSDSIDSVLNQTFQDFDLYVYDDCSTDNTKEIIESFKSSKIHYIKNKFNIGLTKTLNKGLSLLLPEYEYIARMDADDWCFPERFEKQLHYLETFPEFVMCGTQGYWLKDMTQTPQDGWIYPTEMSYIKYNLLFGATFGHSSVILRSQKILEYSLRYDESKINCQDWELWTQISKVGKMANLPDFLMKYRILEHSNHRSPEKQKLNIEYRSNIIASYWKHFGFSFSEKEIYHLYYSEINIDKGVFKMKAEKMINAFNGIFEQSISELSKANQKNFSYKLARRVLSYWKRSGVNRMNPFIWFFILKKIRFMGKMRLIKSLIR